MILRIRSITGLAGNAIERDTVHEIRIIEIGPGSQNLSILGGGDLPRGVVLVAVRGLDRCTAFRIRLRCLIAFELA